MACDCVPGARKISTLLRLYVRVIFSLANACRADLIVSVGL